MKSDGSDVDLANVRMSMNPFDEIAVEAAMPLKERGQATVVVARVPRQNAMPGNLARFDGDWRRRLRHRWRLAHSHAGIDEGPWLK